MDHMEKPGGDDGEGGDEGKDGDVGTGSGNDARGGAEMTSEGQKRFKLRANS